MATTKELLVKIGADNKGLKQGLREAKQETKSFSSSIKKIGGIIAGAFAISKIAQFTGEIINLAGETEGVENAFRRVGDAALLENLRKATRGTVSDLELMKKTVQAANFGIALEPFPDC